MEKLILKKLIVISDVEQKSKEITFDEGLNIIYGTNKTGKSSLIKSIFYTFGCRVVFEDEWKSIINKFLLYFKYGTENFCILRQDSLFKMYKLSETTQELIIESDDFHTYSEKLMEVLGVSINFTTNNGKNTSITPPLLFRFQYIDQDKGWSKIGESFNNMQYFVDWKANTNKYVVGFQGEEYYRKKQERDNIKDELAVLLTKISNYNEILINMSNQITGTKDDDINKLINKPKETRYILNDAVITLNQLEKENFAISERLAKKKNDRYEKLIEIDYLKTQVELLANDHEFAMGESETLECPFCGTSHHNSIEERTEIVKDIQMGNQLINQGRKELKEIEETIDSLNTSKRENYRLYNKLKLYLEKMEENASIISSYKLEGKINLLQNTTKERDNIKNIYDKKLGEKDEIERYLVELNSREKRDEIYEGLKRHYRNVLQKLNISSTYMRFNDFVQVLSRTGSELPRIIYAYHSALFLYNLERDNNLFTFLVIDTPNQQGQDQENLRNIDSVLELFTKIDGQVILGTERETGFEEDATHVTKLTEYKKCLVEENYTNHSNIVQQLNSLS